MLALFSLYPTQGNSLKEARLSKAKEAPMHHDCGD